MSKSPILVLDLERRRIQSESDEVTQVDIRARRIADAMREPSPPITRGQALYAVLWFGHDAREVRRYL